MKATLIIKNINHLYTCDQHDTVLHHAYIAIHHEWIISVGTGSFRDLTDDATRVLDAAGEIVVPAFIEACYDMPEETSYSQMLRHEHDTLWQLQKNGILTVMTKAGRIQQRTLKQDVFRSRPAQMESVTFGMDQLPAAPYVLSCQGPGQTRTFQPAAFYLRHMLQADPMDLLKAMSVWPAEAQGLKDRGVLEAGKLADLLVFRVPDLEALFDQADMPSLRRIIKNGIPVWPDVIRC